jgi:hypothetical protein
MMSDLPQEDRFKLLPLGIFMDGETGEGARPGAANLSLFGHHEETWKQLLRRAVAAGWLILRERGGSRKGPNGTRIKRASRYAASVPGDVYRRREEILGAAPYRATKEARPQQSGQEQGEDALPSTDAGLPSKDAPSTKEVQHASFNGHGPVDNPSTLTYEGSPDTLPSTAGGSTKEASRPTKEVREGHEGSPQRLPHQSVPPSTSTSSKDRSDRRARDDVQDRKGARWLIDNWPGVTEEIAAHIIKAVRAEARHHGSEISYLAKYLQRMHERDDLADYVASAFDHFDGENEQPLPEPPPLTAIEGKGRSTGAPSQPSLLLHAVPDHKPEPAPVQEPPRDLGLPPHIVQAALSQLTMSGFPYASAAAKWFATHEIDATPEQVDAYALQLAWDTPKDRDVLARSRDVAAALERNAG